MIKEILEAEVNESEIDSIKKIANQTWDLYDEETSRAIMDVLDDAGFLIQFTDDRLGDNLDYILSELVNNKFDSYIIGDNDNWAWAFKKSDLKKVQKKLDRLI